MRNLSRPLQVLFFGSLMVFVEPLWAEANDSSSLVEETERFSFHSNFWLNLHHYLYNEAQKPDGAPLDGGRLMSRAQFEQLDGAVDWYREQFSKRSLLMDTELYAIKRALIGYGPDRLPEHPAISPALRSELTAAEAIYRRYHWPRHDQQNREVVSWHLDLIRSIEHPVLDRIAELAQQAWPEEKIRIDLTWYANWAGAYCTTEPIHAVLTSRTGGPNNTWPPGGWLELLFHEPSHAVIDPSESKIGELVRSIADEVQYEKGDQLWHALLFYFSGAAVQEALAERGIDHQLLMKTEGIFSRYHEPIFKHVGGYVAGEERLESAVEQAIRALKAE